MIADKETGLLELLLERMGDMSRNSLKRHLQSGRVLVNGKSVKRHDHIVNVGDTVEIGRNNPSVGDLGNRFVRLVYEDNHLVVVEKKVGILSMATSHHSFCVKRVLDSYFERCHTRYHAHLVHRLDRDTSGLMIFAKSRDVQQRFMADWKGQVYDRRYVVVARGIMEQKEGKVSNWLKDTKQYFTYSSNVDNGGKLAVTHYRVLKTGKANTLVELRLDTGRKNQIRVHLSDLQHPIVGDRKYGEARVDDKTGREIEGRLCLHAYRLHFIHPVTGEDMHFDTPIPKDFAMWLDCF